MGVGLLGISAYLLYYQSKHSNVKISFLESLKSTSIINGLILLSLIFGFIWLMAKYNFWTGLVSGIMIWTLFTALFVLLTPFLSKNT